MFVKKVKNLYCLNQYFNFLNIIFLLFRSYLDLSLHFLSSKLGLGGTSQIILFLIVGRRIPIRRKVSL